MIPSTTVNKKLSQPNERRLNLTLPHIPSDILNNGATCYIGWHLLLTILILFIPILLGLWNGSTASAASSNKDSYKETQAAQNQQDGEPLVFAFYYSWFDESIWYSNTLSDQPVRPYASRERAIMGQHIEQAQRAGIDAFLVAWYGPGTNQTEPNLAALLEEAASRNFKIGILFESDAPTFRGIGDISAALQHARTVHMQHPAYIRVGGKPVMFFWRNYIYDVGTWTSVRNQVDPSGSQIWISEGIDVSFLSTFDGHHLYSNTWKPANDLGYTNQKFARWVQNAREKHGKRLYWVSTVMPGYDDVRIRPSNGYRTSREGGAYYERGWQAAIESNPDWIVVNSFNEWPEGTYIEPSVTYGDLFLTLTASWSLRYTGRAATVYAPSAPQPQTASPVPSVPIQSPPQPLVVEPIALNQITPNQIAVVDVDLLNVRSQPNTSSAIVAQLTSETELRAVARATGWIQVAWTQAGNQQKEGWVYEPMVRLQSLAESAVSSTIEMAQPSTTVATNSPIGHSLSSVQNQLTDSTAVERAATDGGLAESGEGAENSPAAIVAVPSLNLRKEPNTKSAVVRLLLEEMVLPITGTGLADADLDEVLAESGDFDAASLKDARWLQVTHGEYGGWIYSPMVRISGDLKTISTVGN